MGKIIKKKERIANMFDEIAPVYDSTGHVLSMGVDRIWRKKIRKQIAKIPISPLHILDLATGTGDLAIEISKINNSQIVGIDIATKMLDVAINKADKSLASSNIVQFNKSHKKVYVSRFYYKILKEKLREGR